MFDFDGQAVGSTIIQVMLQVLMYLAAVILLPMSVFPKEVQQKLGFRRLNFRGGGIECSSIVGRLMLAGWGICWFACGVMLTLDILSKK